MRLTVWGARGSIPVSGPQYLRYGGDTTCAEIETDGGETIILDAGTGLRPLGNKFMAEGRTTFHFLLTHAHWDHLLGFPFFRPLYEEETIIYFHGCTNAQQSVKTFLKATMQPPFFPIALEDVEATIQFDSDCAPDQEVGGLCCQSILLNHPNHGYGFRLTEKDRSVAFFPDNELSYHHPKGKSFDEYAAFVEGVDLLIHDGAYSPEEYEAFSRGWGHSIYTDTVRLAVEASAKRLLLWHLNQERSDDQADSMQEKAREALREAGTRIECDIARTGLQIEI